MKGDLKMSNESKFTKVELDAKPLSWWINNAIERLKVNAIPKNVEVLGYTFDIWKEMALKQEKQIAELKEEREAWFDAGKSGWDKETWIAFSEAVDNGTINLNKH